MNEFDVLIVKLHAHNLKQPHRSFDKNLTTKDFRDDLTWPMVKANKVVYVNPKGEEQVIKIKKAPKRGIYDEV